MACGIFPDQGSNLGPLHWQVDPFICLFVCLFNFIYGCIGSSLLRTGSLVAVRGATLRCGAQASLCSGFSCAAWALGAWASVVVARGL